MFIDVDGMNTMVDVVGNLTEGAANGSVATVGQGGNASGEEGGRTCEAVDSAAAAEGVTCGAVTNAVSAEGGMHEAAGRVVDVVRGA